MLKTEAEMVLNQNHKSTRPDGIIAEMMTYGKENGRNYLFIEHLRSSKCVSYLSNRKVPAVGSNLFRPTR